MSFRPTRNSSGALDGPQRRIVVAILSVAIAATSGLLSHARPKDAEVDDFEKAREHLQKGRIDEALEVYDELEKAGADPARVAVGRSLCFEAQGEWKQATDALTAAAPNAGKSAPLWARLADVHLAQGRFEDSEKSVAQALKINENFAPARLVQAELYAATGQLKKADAAFHWFITYYNKAQPADAGTLLAVARGATVYARWHSNSQMFDFVINTLCPDALKDDPTCWQAHLIAGELLLEKFNRAQALPELKKALAINPRAAAMHTALARAALQQHGLAEAEQHAARALEINPRLVAALLVRAELALEDGDISRARKELDAALTVNAHDERTLARVAACDLLEDGPPPATQLDELFSNLDNIGDAAFDKPVRFVRLTAELARVNPHPGVFLNDLGEQLEGHRRFDMAERCYRQAVASMPQLPGPKTALGMLYMRVGKIDEARKILDQAFDADPYHVRVSNMRKVLKLLDSYDTIATEHFVIRVDSQADKILGRYMAEFLEEEYPGLVKQFGYEPESRTQFEIYNKAKGLSAHQWFSARMVGLPWVQTIGASTGMIVALASPTASEKPFNWARVLKHEFVHIITLQQTQFNIPHWYTEALAVTTEGYPRPEIWNQLLLERVPKGDLMNLDNINLGFIRPKTPLDWQMAYCQSRLYAQYMTDKFGPEKPGQLLEAYKQNLSTDQAIPKVFGVDKAAFEKGYREFLEAIVVELRVSQREESAPLAEIEKAHLANPDDTRAAARYAHELMKINRRKDARKLAVSVLEKNKSEPLAAVVMAQLELRSEDVPAAIGWLEPALDREHPHPAVLELLAELHLKQNEIPQAADLYELGLKQDPDHVPWLKGLATAYLKSRDAARLKTILEKLAVTDADDAPVRRRLARMALDEKNFAEAVRYGKMTLHIDVLDVETHRILAEAYAGLGQHEKSAGEWSVALELKPDDLDLTVELARAEAAGGKKEAAAARLNELLKRNPDFGPAKELLDELK